MKKLKKVLQRPLAALAAVALLFGVAAPLVLQHLAFAAGQVQERSIKLSTAVPNATGVTYSVSFKPTQNFTNPDFVIEFCDDSPLIGAACSFDNTTASTNTVPLFSGATSSVGTLTSLGSNNVVRINGGTTGSLTSGSAFTFTISGVRNPAVAESFYARIYVYATGNAATDYTAPASDDTAATFVGGASAYVDYGGIAMATVTTINITARVMETLSLCTSATDISGTNYDPLGNLTDTDCTDATTPSLVIGHGSPTAVIDAGSVDTTPAYFQMSTNATTGAVIRMKATNACANGGLSTDGGTTCSSIPGITTTTAPVLMNAGTAGFGLYVSPSVLTNGVATSTGTITPSTVYNDGTHNAPDTDNFFALETGGTGVTSTYGSTIASCSGPVSQVNTMLTFGATASLTTPAGIYTGGESLIATGTF
jgi:hypothetical protein